MKNIISKIIIFLCLFLSFPFTVFADYKDDIEKEKQLFEEVTELEKNKNYNAAIEKYLEIIEIYNRNKLPNLLSLPYKKIADNYCYLKDYKKSFEYYQKAIEINKYNISDIMFIFYGMAQNYEDINDLDNAIKYYDIAADLSQIMNNITPNNNITIEELSLYGKGRCYKKQSRFEEALIAFKSAEAVYEKIIKDDKSLDKIYEINLMSLRLDIANIFQRLYRYQELLEYSEKVVLYYDTNKLWTSYKYYNLAELYLSAEGFDKALNMAKKAEENAKDFSKVMSLIIASKIYFKLNQYENVNETIEKAENIIYSIQNTNDKKYCLGFLLANYILFQNYNKVYETSENLLKITNKEEEIIYINSCILLLYLFTDNIEKAEKLGDEISKKINYINTNETKIWMYILLGITSERAFKYEKSYEYYENASKLSEESGNLMQFSLIKAGMGNNKMINGNYNIALVNYEESLKMAKKIKYIEIQSSILLRIGMIYLNEKNFEKAIEYFENTMIFAKKNNQLNNYYLSLFYLGIVSYQQKNYIKALGYFENAIDVIEKIRNFIEDESLKTYYYSQKSLFYEGVISSLLNIQKETNKDIFDLSFKYNEFLKARTMLDIIEKKNNQLKEINKLYKSSVPINLMIDKKIITENNFVQTDDVKKILDKNTCLLEYFIGSNNIVVWLVKNDKNIVLSLIDNDKDMNKFTENLEKYKKLLNRPILNNKEKEEFIFIGKYFYSILIKPLEENLKSVETLVIVPDGPLFFIPFESFIVESKEDNSLSQKYLVENYNIKYIQSASLFVKLKELEDKNKPTKPKEKTLLAFGDPIFNKNEKQVSSIYNLRGMDINEDEIFQQLPFSGEEINRITKVFKTSKNMQDIYLKNLATEDHFKNSNLKQYKFIHIATHGIISDEIKGVDQPALVFSLANIDNKKNDGFLTMAEIRNLNIDADLVVLSACKTGKGKLVSGEGVLGLTRSFMIAGTKRLIISLWDVNDLSTCEFMETFYKYIADGMEIDKALRKTKLDIMKKSIWNKDIQENISLQNPFYWAPFVLYGN